MREVSSPVYGNYWALYTSVYLSVAITALIKNYYDASAANQSLYPAKAWRNGMLIISIALSYGFLLWLLNLLFDGEAGFIHG